MQLSVGKTSARSAEDSIPIDLHRPKLMFPALLIDLITSARGEKREIIHDTPTTAYSLRKDAIPFRQCE